MKKQILYCILFLLTLSSWAQTAQVKGVVLNESNIPLAGAEVTYNASKGIQTDNNGVYLLEIPANSETTIKVSYVGLKMVTFKVNLKPSELTYIYFESY